MRRRNATRHLAAVEPLEERLCLASSVGWDGPGRGSASLTYYIGAAPASLSQAAVDAAIKTALNAWSSVASIKFTQTMTPGLNRSLDFTFRTIDGRGGTLAEGYFPADVNPARIAGDVRFDASETWEVGNARGSAAFDLVFTAVHEIGHALGLDHSRVAGSVMYPSVSANKVFTGLTTTDATSIRSLYAPATSSTANVISTTPATTTTTTNTDTTTTNTNTTTRFNGPRWFNRFPWFRFG